MAGPDPRRGVLRWARIRSREHIAGKWLVGGALFAVLLGIGGGLVGLPKNPDFWDRTRQGIIVGCASAGALVIIVYLAAVFLAPYEQRNALRVALAKVSEKAAPAPRRSDPALDSLLKKLAPVFQEGQFLLARRADPGGYDPHGFRTEVRTWTKKVSAVLEDHPLYQQQFKSNPGFSYLDDAASREIEHRMKMLELIVTQLLPPEARP